ncbi:MAG TPA: hypothetical protein VIP11_00665 [Gemmatimonadaceae bacterium]
MTSLKSKRVLVIAPRFFGYDQEIVAEVKRRDAEVWFVPDRPFRSAFMIAMAKVATTPILTVADSYYERAIRDLRGVAFDVVLVVNGQTLSPLTMRRFRSAFPNARFVLWAWDSVRNRPAILRNRPFFDVCASFDPDDAETYGLRFRPSFFSPGFEREAETHPTYDLSFIGTAHTDRYAVVRRVQSTLPKRAEAFWHLYLQAPWVFWYYRATKPAFRDASRSDFRFAPLSRTEVESIFFKSRAILEIEHPEQRGLTMRTFEAIAANKKLITTNPRIREYAFYHPSNVHVIDRASPEIPEDFLAADFVPVGEEFYARYRISAWLDELLA